MRLSASDSNAASPVACDPKRPPSPNPRYFPWTRPRIPRDFGAIRARVRRPRAMGRARKNPYEPSARTSDEQLPLHLRVRHRRPPRQDLRRRIRRDPRRRPDGRQVQSRGLRDAVQDGLRGDCRRNHHEEQHRFRKARAFRDQGHRLHRFVDGLRLRDLRCAYCHRATVRRHLPGCHRRSGHVQGAGRGRPGFDVRLRFGRDPGADARSDRLRARAGQQARPGAQQKKVDFLRPDGKSQVTLEYENGVPKRIETVVVSSQHSPDVKHKDLRDAVMELVIKKALPANLLDKKTKFFVNPTGRFVIGGPFGDAGLTGRKIIVDSYGGMGRHGGGAFSGKDPSKVDRSACYYARYVAKNIVAAGVASRCEVQVAYAIGVAQPTGVYVHTFGTGKVADDVLGDYVLKNFDMRPRALIEELDLLRPIYRPTSAYGHFGRSEFSWESTSRAEKIAHDLLGTPLKSKPAKTANGAAKGKPAKPAKPAAKPAKGGKRSSATA